MTIIAPKQNKLKFNLFFVGLLSLLFVMAFWSVSVYNQTVDLRHAVSDGHKQLEGLKISNAELKNQFYSLIDSQNLIILSEKLGLIKINSPHYLEASDESWSAVSVSQF